MILEGLLTINGNDVYLNYGAYLTEDRSGDMKNYNALLCPGEMKEVVRVDYPDETGCTYPDSLPRAIKEKDITLHFAICAPDKATFINRYYQFGSMLRTGSDGWLTIEIPELNMTRIVYLLKMGNYNQLTDFDSGVIAAFDVTFREPNPQF